MLEFKDVNEQTRTYHYPSGMKYKFENVVKVAISNSTHRLETFNGKKYIVRDGWDVIELDVAEWSF